MNLVQLPYFLSSYLSVDDGADIVRALRTLAIKEPETFLEMRVELRQLLSATTDLGEVRDVFRTQGLFLLPEETAATHRMLRDIYAHSEAIMTTPPSSKPYDVFISHSSHDRAVASRLAKELAELGYVVWADAWESLTGHSISDEVYKAIAGARFVVVLLSPNSSNSGWVTHEWTIALAEEVQASQVVVLPAKIGDCIIPAWLADRRYADFTASWEEGFRELTAAMDLHRAETQLRREIAESRATNLSEAEFDELDEWRANLLPSIASVGFREGESFKDVLIGPIDGIALKIDKTRLKSIVDASRVYLHRWGGPPFPYDKYPSTEEIRLDDSLRYVDTRPWPYRDQSFHFWQIDGQFHFLHRTHIDEDFCRDESGELSISRKMVRAWALIDLVRPLLFAQGLLIHELGLRKLGVKFVWGGLQDRELLELAPNRVGYFGSYQAKVPTWSYEIEVSRDSDIAKEARRVALNLFWLFGFDPDDIAMGVLDSDLVSLSRGSFPD